MSEPVEQTPRTDDPAAQRTEDQTERDRARRRQDSAGVEHDPREDQEPPQPFSGSEH